MHAMDDGPETENSASRPPGIEHVHLGGVLASERAATTRMERAEKVVSHSSGRATDGSARNEADGANENMARCLPTGACAAR
jgi:hypothetical protein